MSRDFWHLTNSVNTEQDRVDIFRPQSYGRPIDAHPYYGLMKAEVSPGHAWRLLVRRSTDAPWHELLCGILPMVTIDDALELRKAWMAK